MSVLTELEFWKLQDEKSHTDLQRDTHWRDRVAGQTISWRGAVSRIEQVGQEIQTEVVMHIADGKSVWIHFRVPLIELDHYLRFSPGIEVEVTGTFPKQRPADKAGIGYPIVGGHIRFVD